MTHLLLLPVGLLMPQYAFFRASSSPRVGHIVACDEATAAAFGRLGLGVHSDETRVKRRFRELAAHSHPDVVTQDQTCATAFPCDSLSSYSFHTLAADYSRAVAYTKRMAEERASAAWAGPLASAAVVCYGMVHDPMATMLVGAALIISSDPPAKADNPPRELPQPVESVSVSPMAQLGGVLDGWMEKGRQTLSVWAAESGSNLNEAKDDDADDAWAWPF
jgi:hypothetical protein